jgi:hypothetical protein
MASPDKMRLSLAARQISELYGEVHTVSADMPCSDDDLYVIERLEATAVIHGDTHLGAVCGGNLMPLFTTIISTTTLEKPPSDSYVVFPEILPLDIATENAVYLLIKNTGQTTFKFVCELFTDYICVRPGACIIIHAAMGFLFVQESPVAQSAIVVVFSKLTLTGEKIAQLQAALK